MSIASAPNCNVGSWTQKWECGLHQPVSPAVTHAGYATGHTGLPLIIGLLIGLIIIAMIRKGSGRSAATSK